MHLELRGITKRFPGVIANRDVNLTVQSGEILGLLGENGAGKSTLMNVVYGLYSAEEGEILIDGEVQNFGSPGDAIAAGIGMVHQHFMLVPVFTVAENVVLGVEPTKGGQTLDMAKAREQVREISQRYGLNVDPDAIVEELPIGLQQRVEILKVLFREAEILVFDEPTAVLTPQEVEDFFEIIRMLQADGKGIIFITHKLKEVKAVADRVAVLRRGEVVGEANPQDLTPDQLAELMVGRPVDLVVDKGPARPGEPVLELRNVSVLDHREHPAVRDVSFTIHAGEIVGIAGVQGNGQTELVEAITGLAEITKGTITLNKTDITNATPRTIHDAGVAHVPEDRQRDGLVMDFTLVENSVLNSYHNDYSKGIVMDWDKSREHAEQVIEAYDVRTPSVDVTASTLSGGNQQKVIVGREFSRPVELAVASQPTRGLDVGSIEYIHEQVVALRDRGAAVLIVSAELDEILALSDRILVMFAGRVVAETTPDQTSPAQLGLYMAGSAPDSKPPGADAGVANSSSTSTSGPNEGASQ